MNKPIEGIIVGLLFDCPFKGNDDCSLFGKVRKMPVVDRLIWFNALSDMEKQEIFCAHRACLLMREQNKLMKTIDN